LKGSNISEIQTEFVRVFGGLIPSPNLVEFGPGISESPDKIPPRKMGRENLLGRQ